MGPSTSDLALPEFAIVPTQDGAVGMHCLDNGILAPTCIGADLPCADSSVHYALAALRWASSAPFLTGGLAYFCIFMPGLRLTAGSCSVSCCDLCFGGPHPVEFRYGHVFVAKGE